jgi:hypothetical protein
MKAAASVAANSQQQIYGVEKLDSTQEETVDEKAMNVSMDIVCKIYHAL